MRQAAASHRRGPRKPSRPAPCCFAASVLCGRGAIPPSGRQSRARGGPALRARRSLARLRALRKSLPSVACAALRLARHVRARGFAGAVARARPAAAESPPPRHRRGSTNTNSRAAHPDRLRGATRAHAPRPPAQALRAWPARAARADRELTVYTEDPVFSGAAIRAGRSPVS